MIPQINILTMVDVIRALSTGSLTGSMYMADNRQGKRTFGEGTSALTTDTTYTQVLNRHVMAIDFQTDIQIEKITFYRNGAPVTRADTPCVRLQKYGAPSGHYWAGVINYAHLIEGGLYQYLIEFDIGRKKMAMEQFAAIHIAG